jgi:uncharacterized protein (TIGR02996 family)
MTKHESLLRAIIENPDDDCFRLRYADWLEDNGQANRADFIRVQCRLARLPENDPQRKEMEAREQVLLEEHEREWLQPFGEEVAFAEFRRGFVWGLMLTAPAFVERAEELFGTTPLQHARICVDSASMPAFAASPWLSRLTSLSLESCDLPSADIGILARSPHLTNLTTLDLYENHTGSRGLQALAHSPQLRKLRSLHLGWNGIGSAGLRALAASSLLGQLTNISFFHNRIGGRGAVALARSPHAASLTHLDFRGNDIDNAGGRALAESLFLTSLVWLDLHMNGITEGTRELLRARFGDRVHF